MLGKRQDGPVAKMLIEGHKDASIVYGPGQHFGIIGTCHPHIRNSHHIIFSLGKDASDFGIEHLVEKQAPLFHAFTGSSSVCSMNL